MSKQPAPTRPRQAASKSTVNDVQRQLMAEALRLSVTAKELAGTATRLLALNQQLQRSQRR